MGLYAFDKTGKPITLGTMVTYLDTSYKSPRDVCAPIEEITFKRDGTVILRLFGRKSKPVDAVVVTRVDMTDAEQKLMDEFLSRGVAIGVDDVRSILTSLDDHGLHETRECMVEWVDERDDARSLAAAIAEDDGTRYTTEQVMDEIMS